MGTHGAFMHPYAHIFIPGRWYLVLAGEEGAGEILNRSLSTSSLTHYPVKIFTS